MRLIIIILMLPALAAFAGGPAPKTCTYQVYNWNIYSKGPVNQGRPGGVITTPAQPF